MADEVEEAASFYLTSDPRTAAIINAVPGLFPAKVSPLIPKDTLYFVDTTAMDSFLDDFKWPEPEPEPELPQPLKDFLERMVEERKIISFNITP